MADVGDFDVRAWAKESQEVDANLRSRVQELFSLFDENGDGTLDVHELQQLAFMLGDTFNDAEVQAFMKQLDKDGNGSIDFEEFYAWWTSKPTGTISPESSDPKITALQTKLRSQTFMRAITNVFSRLTGTNTPKKVEEDKNMVIDVLFKAGEMQGPKDGFRLHIHQVAENGKSIRVVLSLKPGITPAETKSLQDSLQVLFDFVGLINPKAKISSAVEGEKLILSVSTPPVPAPIGQIASRIPFEFLFDVEMARKAGNPNPGASVQFKGTMGRSVFQILNSVLAGKLPPSALAGASAFRRLTLHLEMDGTSELLKKLGDKIVEKENKKLGGLSKLLPPGSEGSIAISKGSLELLDGFMDPAVARPLLIPMVVQLLSKLPDNELGNMGKDAYYAIAGSLGMLESIEAHVGPVKLEFKISAPIKLYDLLPTKAEIEAASKASAEFTFDESHPDSASLPKTGKWIYATDTKSGKTYWVQVVEKSVTSAEDSKIAAANATALEESASSPSVLKYHKSVTEDGKTYYFYEHIPGARVLSEVLAQGPLAPARARKAITQFAKLLELFHSSNKVLVDSNPSRFIITPEGDIKLFNPGLALASAWTNNVEPSGSLYEPPEVVKLDYHGAAQAWALGAFAFGVTTGKPPFSDLAALRDFTKFESTDPLWVAAEGSLKEFVLDLLTSNWSRPKIPDVAIHPFLSDEVTTSQTVERVSLRFDTPVGWTQFPANLNLSGFVSDLALFDASPAQLAKGLALIVMDTVPGSWDCGTAHTVVSNILKIEQSRHASPEDVKVTKFANTFSFAGVEGYHVGYEVDGQYEEHFVVEQPHTGVFRVLSASCRVDEQETFRPILARIVKTAKFTNSWPGSTVSHRWLNNTYGVPFAAPVPNGWHYGFSQNSFDWTLGDQTVAHFEVSDSNPTFGLTPIGPSPLASQFTVYALKEDPDYALLIGTKQAVKFGNEDKFLSMKCRGEVAGMSAHQSQQILSALLALVSPTTKPEDKTFYCSTQYPVSVGPFTEQWMVNSSFPRLNVEDITAHSTFSAVIVTSNLDHAFASMAEAEVVQKAAEVRHAEKAKKQGLHGSVRWLLCSQESSEPGEKVVTSVAQTLGSSHLIASVIASSSTTVSSTFDVMLKGSSLLGQSIDVTAQL